MPLLVENVKDNVETEEKCEEALDDQRVVGEAHDIIQDAGQRRPEEVAGSEGGGEQPGDRGLRVRSCGESWTNS